MRNITIDIGDLFSGEETAKLSKLPEYVAAAKSAAGTGNVVTLTGRGPIWLYLKVAHELHGLVRKLKYDSPVTGEVVIFDHSPE